ncbi:hypothetical protein RP20_CCG020340 [Aedes albopictus]|nr:hypothetical protein RP20_CCG020340 [Aedes albopictus]
MVRGSENVACTNTDSAYAVRVIKYRKQEFYTLKTGAAQRNVSISCEEYKPNQCDGDDNRVYEVARSTMNSVANLIMQSIKPFHAELARELNYKKSIEQQIATDQQKYNQLDRVNSDLVNYINDEYQYARLSGKSDPITQLNEIFEHYERENARRMNEIRTEERRNEDKLNEITAVENDIDDLESQKNQLLKELNECNRTLIILQAIQMNNDYDWT